MDEKYNLFDSGIFNNITKGFVLMSEDRAEYIISEWENYEEPYLYI